VLAGGAIRERVVVEESGTEVEERSESGEGDVEGDEMPFEGGRPEGCIAMRESRVLKSPKAVGVRESDLEDSENSRPSLRENGFRKIGKKRKERKLPKPSTRPQSKLDHPPYP
jgi:hypothetical protein